MRCEVLKGVDDLFFLSKNILGYSLLEEKPHKEICEFIETWKKRKKMLLLPRGSLKTTIGTVANATQRILQNPNIRILLASETVGQSIKFLSEIKGHFENQKFQSYYGNWQGEKGWKDNEITVSRRTVNKKEPTISTAGIDVTKTGFHYDLIIVDDPHSQKNVTNAEQIRQVIEWYKLLLSMLEPNGQIMIIGTRWAFDDLYGVILESLIDEYQIMVRKAVDENGVLFWASRLGLDFLESQLKEQGSYIFHCQYQMEPVATEDQTFNPEDFKYYESEIEWPKNLDIFITLDPSLTEDERARGDCTAMVVVGLDEMNNWWILDLLNEKISAQELNEKFLDLILKWKPIDTGIESEFFQKLLKPSFEKYCLEKKISIPPIQELKSGGRSKELRIKSLQPLFEQKKVYMKKPDALNRDVWYTLYQQLVRFPRASHDDLIDALAYGNNLVYYREKLPEDKRLPTKYQDDPDAPWNQGNKGHSYNNIYSH